MNYKIAIIDDEEDARELIKIHLRRYPNLILIGEASNGRQALELINNAKPEIVLLDIQMPEMNGLDVLLNLSNQPLIIFITAYDEFAIKAFELNAIDYLLKPYSANRFDDSINRAIKRLTQSSIEKDFYHLLLKDIRENQNQGNKYIERIAYKQDSKTIYIDANKIQLIEAADQYVNVYTTEKKYLLRQSMDYLEEILDPEQFFRTHRSFIVKLKEVAYVEQFGPRMSWIYLKNGKKAKLSQVRKQLFNSKLNLG